MKNPFDKNYPSKRKLYNSKGLTAALYDMMRYVNEQHPSKRASEEEEEWATLCTYALCILFQG
jgi:hypothetical protein